MQPLLGVLVATLVGGLIGYITNIVAVRMLFRPEHPIGIGPFKIQGLIPSRRTEIAVRLAEVVASYMRPEDVEAVLAGAFERGGLEEYVKEKVAQALRSSKPLRLFSSMSPEAFEKLVESVATSVSRSFSGYARRIGRELAPILAERIDVASIIRRRAEEISLDEVERMFRQVAGPELRRIEVAGLALGATIGVIQGVINYLIIPYLL